MSTELPRSKCDKCGNDYTLGEWPWCPHGSAKNFGEEPLEPYIDEHLTDEHPGILITSRGQRRKIMDKKGFDYKKKFEKPPGMTLYFDQKGR
ncbi:MAG: hypothetical protein ACW99J_20660 [Candidatus Thorarchaeota archaeon]|jgi:hypothetical protein